VICIFYASSDLQCCLQRCCLISWGIEREGSGCPVILTPNIPLIGAIWALASDDIVLNAASLPLQPILFYTFKASTSWGSCIVELSIIPLWHCKSVRKLWQMEGLQDLSPEQRRARQASSHLSLSIANVKLTDLNQVAALNTIKNKKPAPERDFTLLFACFFWVLATLCLRMGLACKMTGQRCQRIRGLWKKCRRLRPRNLQTSSFILYVYVLVQSLVYWHQWVKDESKTKPDVAFLKNHFYRSKCFFYPPNAS